MKKLIYILVFTLNLQVCFADNLQDASKDKTEKITSLFESNSNEPSEYDAYAKASKNNVIYNSSLGSSKYDKDINLDTDIDSKNVEGSLESYRNKRQSEDLKEIISISLFILVALGIMYLAYIGFFKKKKIKK